MEYALGFRDDVIRVIRVTGPFCGGIHRSPMDPLTKANDAEVWCFLWPAPEQTVQQTLKTLVIWDAIAIIMASLYWLSCSVL